MSTPFLISFAIFAAFVAIVVYLIRCLAAFPEARRELSERGYSDHQIPGDDCCGDCLNVSGHAVADDADDGSEDDTKEFQVVQFIRPQSEERFAPLRQRIDDVFPQRPEH